MSLSKLRWSSEIQETCEVRYTLTAEEALQVLCNELLGTGYYIADPVSGPQANAIIVNDILKRYAPRKRKGR